MPKEKISPLENPQGDSEIKSRSVLREISKNDSRKHLPNKDQLASEKQTPFFKASTQIYRKDGWLSGNGIFWGCRPDEHDASARYILEKKEFLSWDDEKESDDKIQELSLARKTLAENGFVQLNNGTLILPKAPLTDKQIQRINEAGLRIPLRLEYSGDITRDFKGMSLSIKLELFSNEAIELIREFFNNKCRFKVDNDPPKANVLFEALTIGFEQGGYYKFSAGYTREYNFKYPKDRDFAIEIITHRHDGYSGLQYSSWIDLVPIKEMVEITGFDPHKGGYNSESQNSGT